jgi:uroporphyrin-III C-methyltransferase / precorrin-2 dehydrogenase / sirohydrochlorin ferrochelatase
MFVMLRDRPCLVVGGGAVAARKVAMLQRAGAHVQVVAPALCDELQRLVAAQRIAHRSGVYMRTDLDAVELVIAATDDAAVNVTVSEDARARRLPVNVVDQPALCSFIVPSIVDRAPVVVAVSTGGAAPVLARHVRAKIETLLPARLGDLAQVAARLRDDVKAQLPDAARRRAFWESVFEGSAMHGLLAGDTSHTEASLRAQLRAHKPAIGTLTVIAVGEGDPDLLTLRALRALQVTSRLVHCGDVPAAVMDLARRDAPRELLAADVAQADVGNLERLAMRVRAGEQVCLLVRGNESPLIELVRNLGVPWLTVSPGRIC